MRMKNVKMELKDIIKEKDLKNKRYTIDFYNESCILKARIDVIGEKGHELLYAIKIIDYVEPAENTGIGLDSKCMPYEGCKYKGKVYEQYEGILLRNTTWSAGMGRIHERQFRKMLELIRDRPEYQEFRAWYDKNRARILEMGEAKALPYPPTKDIDEKVRVNLGWNKEVLGGEEGCFFEPWFVARLEKLGFPPKNVEIPGLDESQRQSVKKLAKEITDSLDNAGFAEVRVLI